MAQDLTAWTSSIVNYRGVSCTCWHKDVVLDEVLLELEPKCSYMIFGNTLLHQQYLVGFLLALGHLDKTSDGYLKRKIGLVASLLWLERAEKNPNDVGNPPYIFEVHACLWKPPYKVTLRFHNTTWFSFLRGSHNWRRIDSIIVTLLYSILRTVSFQDPLYGIVHRRLNQISCDCESGFGKVLYWNLQNRM